MDSMSSGAVLYPFMLPISRPLVIHPVSSGKKIVSADDSMVSSGAVPLSVYYGLTEDIKKRVVKSI